MLNPAERAAVLGLADQCAQAVHRAGLLAAERTARHSAEELNRVVARLSGATTPDQVARVILAHADELGARAAVVMVRGNQHPDQLEVLAATATTGGAAGTRLAIDAPHPLAHAAGTGEPVWIARRAAPAWQDRRFDPPAAASQVALPAQVTVPLTVGAETIGVIGLDFGADPPVFRPEERTGVLTLAAQCAQALDRARLYQAEHDVAEVLQRSLLPRELPPLARLDAAARYLPGAVGVQAGGDWYDVLPVGEHRVALVVGDVVGHGATAAAVMGQLRSALAGYLIEGHPPAAALERLDLFATRAPGAAGSTSACLVLDWETGELCWSRAGHPPVLLVEPGGPRFLDGGAGTVLGVSGRPPYPEASTVIGAGSSVLLYTDGLVERRGEVVDDGLDRLAAAAAGLGELTPDCLAAGLLDAVLDHGAPADDIALVVVRLIPAPLHERLPAEPARSTGSAPPERLAGTAATASVVGATGTAAAAVR